MVDRRFFGLMIGRESTTQFPTDPLTILEPQISRDWRCFIQFRSVVRRIFGAPKLWKGRSGCWYLAPSVPDRLFRSFGFLNPSRDRSQLLKTCRSTDFEARKSWEGQTGCPLASFGAIGNLLTKAITILDPEISFGRRIICSSETSIGGLLQALKLDCVRSGWARKISESLSCFY